MCRIAAFCGHMSTFELLLDKALYDSTFRSLYEDRIRAVLLGLAEAGNLQDLAQYAALSDVNLLITCGAATLDFDSSFAYVAVHGYLQSPEGRVSRYQEVLTWLSSTLSISPGEFLRAANVCLDRVYEPGPYERFIGLFDFLVTSLSMALWACKEDVFAVSQLFVKRFYCYREEDEARKVHASLLRRWLEVVSNVGLDVSQISVGDRLDNDDVKELLSLARQRQQRQWSAFDPIKHNKTLVEIQHAFEAGDLNTNARDKGGLSVIHLAAAYDRVDLLEWLVDRRSASLSTFDGRGRDALAVAEASQAQGAYLWIAERQSKAVLTRFMFSVVRRKILEKHRYKYFSAATLIQSKCRGVLIRRKYGARVLVRVEGSARFSEFWGRSLEVVSQLASSKDIHYGWQGLKEQLNVFVLGDGVEPDLRLFEDTTRHLNDAMQLALAGVEYDVSPVMEEQEPGEGTGVVTTSENNGESARDSAMDVGDRILFTSYVEKWLRQGDPKYRQFFVQKMLRLKAGDRSRTMAKPLKGCKSAIFETYLEQKSGYRVLWTQSGDGGLLIWHVAKHKEVSRLARLIDDSEQRSNRQLVSITELPELNADFRDHRPHVVLDPRGNSPLKIYSIRFDEITDMERSSWRPRLHLTPEELSIVEAKGTVLLLGRSGTGKTVCICNRMDCDREKHDAVSDFSQLFVSRSKRLCNYVEHTVGGRHGSVFTTFEQLVQRLEVSIPTVEGIASSFVPSRKMTFERFKNEFFLGDSDHESGTVDALLVWTHIRSFLKGSIEAKQHSDRILPEDEYLKLGRRRCRLNQEQRVCVYKVFERYKKFTSDKGLWDDCDRITALLQRLEALKEADLVAYDNLRYSKAYVDEIQDYTQAEILLFIYLSGPDDLFLAGDPAQSVVEGVEFRFEDVRSVGYYLGGSGSRKDFIPDKPKTVNVNFRSHSGVLDTAAAVLRCLFDVFPDSAKELPVDRGLFTGPRPGLFDQVTTERLCELVGRLAGAVVLTHDSNVIRWKHALNGYPFVYGIREAKGLEFQTVIIADFFCGLPGSLQKAWRNMLLGRDTGMYTMDFPEVEGQLKLLYTAITRCINRLFFAETRRSVSGSAFVRWLTTSKGESSSSRKSSLGERCSVDSVEKMTLTADEWRSSGFDNAIQAEEKEDLAVAEASLERAIYCFRQVSDSELASKGRLHLYSVRFRKDLVAVRHERIVDTSLEVESSRLFGSLVSEGLIGEARRLLDGVLPYLPKYSHDRLQAWVRATD